MRFITAVALAILAATAIGDAQTKTLTIVGPPVVLEISVRRYGADNVMSASAGNSAAAGKLESYVTAPASLCGLSSSSSAPAAAPGVGWHVIGEIISTSDGGMTVRVDWQRLWDKGDRVTDGPKGSATHTLRAGERVELDRVQPSGPSSCNAVDLRLEAAVVTKPAYRLGLARDTRLATRTTAKGMTGTVSGSGTTGTLTTSRAGEFRRTVDRVTPLKSMLRSYSAELWLVHRKPDGTETTVPLTLRFSGTGADYSFPAIQVSTAKGPITIDISGRLLTYVGEPPDPSSARVNRVILFRPGSTDPNTTQRMLVVINRRARATGPPLLDISGGSTIAMEVPAPADVLSFELPALLKAAEDLLKGHQFSLRVKVTPAVQ